MYCRYGTFAELKSDLIEDSVGSGRRSSTQFCRFCNSCNLETAVVVPSSFLLLGLPLPLVFCGDGGGEGGDFIVITEGS